MVHLRRAICFKSVFQTIFTASSISANEAIPTNGCYSLEPQLLYDLFKILIVVGGHLADNVCIMIVFILQLVRWKYKVSYCWP